MTVRFLDQVLINQIAAGEVIERPASALKELVENSIDAGATRIDMVVKEGGRTLISITDNGKGMSQDDLVLAVERHATSKIPDGDLFNIRTLGFRGEALPSIGAVSRLKITTKTAEDENAWELFVEGGVKGKLTPASHPVGTKIEVSDLFYATPARLKFLKSPSTELSYSVDIIHRLSLIHPQIHFTLSDGAKKVINFVEGVDRFAPILGKDFKENACEINFSRDDYTLTGWCSVPTYNKSSSTDQYLFVNGRPVRDKLMSTAIRIAYQDFLASNRHPVLCLFLSCPPEDVDINVHPAKAEVRFRDANLMRQFIIGALRQGLSGAAHRTSTIISQNAIASFKTPHSVIPSEGRKLEPRDLGIVLPARAPSTPLRFNQGDTAFPKVEDKVAFFAPKPVIPTEAHQSGGTPSLETYSEVPRFCTSNLTRDDDHFLGYAKVQVHETYIIAESKEDLIIVDQHAAHERLVYEQFKTQFAEMVKNRQALLIPLVISLTEQQFQLLTPYLPDLDRLGLTIDAYGTQGIVVREVPPLLFKSDIKQLILDTISEIGDRGDHNAVKENLLEILADKACRGSIRSGRKLSIDEMNALLRQMEQTAFSGQCNHGRPTYIRLGRQDLERLFGRT